MNKHACISCLVAAMFALAVPAFAGDENKDCSKAGSPQQLEGTVTKIDASSNKITVKGSDGTTHVFQASAETLKDYKVGDTLKAKLRCSK